VAVTVVMMIIMMIVSLPIIMAGKGDRINNETCVRNITLS